MSTDTFQDFCQAWTSRFPDSELPEAWEQDVRANLAKHTARVSQLREELEKEEMYVEYLDKLLSDIELHRSKSKETENGKRTSHSEINKDENMGKVNGDKGHGDDRLQFLEDQCKLQANLRSSLHLDLNALEDSPKSSISQENKKQSKTGFITVINVKSPNGTANGEHHQSSKTKKCSPDLIKEATAAAGAVNNAAISGPSRFTFDNGEIGSQESLNSVSSPVSPTSSPCMESLVLESLLSPREAPASPREQFVGGALTSNGSSSDNESSEHSGSNLALSAAAASVSERGSNPRVKPEPPMRTVSVKNEFETSETKSNPSNGSSCEDLHSFQSRGRPDGGEEEELASSLAAAVSPPILPPNHPAPTFTTFTKAPVKPPIAAKPDAATRRGSLSAKDRRDIVPPSVKDRRSERELPEIPAGEVAPLSPPVGKRESKTRQNSNSSRGRMGSPGGKSQDSSDQDSWGRRQQLAGKLSAATVDLDDFSPAAGGSKNDSATAADTSPVSKRRVSGEKRLDRLVRRPSLEKPRPEARLSTLDRSQGLKSEARMSTLERSRPLNPDARPLKPLGVATTGGSLLKGVAPPLPKPRKLKQSLDSGDKESISEPLYDAVCNDEPEDEYDNHLLYGTGPRDSNGLDDSMASKDSVKLDSSTVSSSDLDFTGSPSLVKKVTEMDEEESNYVNIQYFLHHTRSSRIDRQDSSGLLDAASEDELTSVKSNHSKSSLDNKSLDSKSSLESKSSLSPAAEAERLKMQTHILQSILDSEAIYLECLSVCLQYMKAMKVTLTTPSPIIPKDEFDIIFYKVPELYEFHHHFYENLKKQVDRWTGEEKIGHHFKMLAQQSKIYAQYLKNYPKALDTLHRCSQQYQKFADLTGSIKLRTLKGQHQGQSVSLEDLLHKPIARVQKNCMSLQDLIKHTPENSADYSNLSESLALMQEFLNVYNLEHRGELYPHQERTSRHLVKNSFIVELSEGVRKLRHLFLFNDVLVCAKYKATNRGERFTFQLKWYIPLSEALIVEDPSTEPKELKPANIVGLKTSAAAIRDQIIQVQREEDWRGSKGRRSGGSLEKPRKQLAELEAQLVLASPHLLLQVSSKSGKTYSFYLSSEFERAQWVETLRTLQASLPPNTSQAHTLSMVELQAEVMSDKTLVRKLESTIFCCESLHGELASFHSACYWLCKSHLEMWQRFWCLLAKLHMKKSTGDLQLVIKSISGLTRPCSLYVVAEIDSYGHFFRKVKSRVSAASLEPVWNEECLIELEGSENLRLLVYQEGGAEGVAHRGRACLELSRSWLTTQYTTQKISLGDLILTCELRFIGYEETTRRVPQSKPAGLFKTPIQQTTKKEKRAVPFIITSCVREVERRGINEVGIYRVSGSSADMARLKKAYETNPYEAEQLLKECDIHSVAGILKQYLRDLPESLFTNAVYYKLLQAYSIPDEELRCKTYLQLLTRLPQNPNQACVVFLIEHLVRVAQFEYQNKMSLHNMATVFGPTMLFPGQDCDKSRNEQLATSTVDVMAQSGILHFFLTRRARGEPIQISS